MLCRVFLPLSLRTVCERCFAGSLLTRNIPFSIAFIISLIEPNLFRHICSDHRLTIGFVSSIFHSSSISPERWMVPDIPCALPLERSVLSPLPTGSGRATNEWATPLFHLRRSFPLLIAHSRFCHCSSPFRLSFPEILLCNCSSMCRHRLQKKPTPFFRSLPSFFGRCPTPGPFVSTFLVHSVADIPLTCS